MVLPRGLETLVLIFMTRSWPHPQQLLPPAVPLLFVLRGPGPPERSHPAGPLPPGGGWCVSMRGSGWGTPGVPGRVSWGLGGRDTRGPWTRKLRAQSRWHPGSLDAWAEWQWRVAACRQVEPGGRWWWWGGGGRQGDAHGLLTVTLLFLVSVITCPRPAS